MGLINFLAFVTIGIVNFGIYRYFGRRHARAEAASQSPQRISALTRLIRYFQNYYGYVAVLYFAFYTFVQKAPLLSPSRTAIGIVLGVTGLLLLAWALSHLGDNFSPCHNALMPRARVTSGPYGYVGHPIYLANTLQFVGFTVANPTWFFATASAVQALLYQSAISDENQALEAEFGRAGSKTRNAPLVALALGALCFGRFGLPWLHLTAPWSLATIVVLACFTGFVWSLVHEAIHGHLLPGKRSNDLAGRVLAMAFGFGFTATRSGHLAHHRLSRTEHELVEVYGTQKRTLHVVSYYATLCGGLYVLSVVGPLLSLLPRIVLDRLLARTELRPSILAPLLRDILTKPTKLAWCRIEAASSLLYVTASVWLFADRWPELALAYSLRALVFSFFDYTYHYGTPLGDPTHAKNLRLPRALEASLLYFNRHGLHHEAPHLPWYRLRDAEMVRFSGGFVRQTLSQLRGPIARASLRAPTAADLHITRTEQPHA